MLDKLDMMFKLQESFMHSLVDSKKDDLPDSWPIDMEKKKSQRLCRDIILRAVEEAFEALRPLKNWKPHRVTDVPGFDRAEVLEELVDTLKYLFEFCILLGFTQQELYDAFVKKDAILHERLRNGY